MTAWPRQGYLSKSMATYPSQSYSPKSRLLCQKLYVQGRATSPRQLVKAAANGHWSTCLSLGYCQWRLVQAKSYSSKSRPPAQVNGHLSKQRLLVNDLIVRVKAATCQACLSMTTCPSQGYLSMACLSMATFQVKADRQWQGHLSKAMTACQSK